ncbi:MAG: helix-turn-helix domain-containing protein [Oscillospiraceae bacterium]|nr:helix-turn-helix domain-containing protein [Oscillospiraceae bacterium]
MTNEELKVLIGSNIARLRKNCRMTQAELAERLNYSDKAVSKWERAESMPDIMTLMALAKEFGTTVNDLLSQPGAEASLPAEPEAQPEPVPAPQPEAKPKSRNHPMRTANRRTIQGLSSVLVWMVALFIFMVTDSFGLKHSWLVFLLAVVANAIVLLSLRSAWQMYGINRILVSIIMWTSLTFFYLVIWLTWQISVWRIFLMGGLGQMAILLWFKLFKHPNETKKEVSDHD